MKTKWNTYKIIGVIFLLPFSLFLNAQSVGISSIEVTLENAPLQFNITKAPLKYNKDFALSYMLDDGLKDAYTHAFKLLNGGTADGQTYPGLFYTDGCGNDINFTMSTALFSLNNDKDIHEPGTDNALIYITWPEIIEMYKAGWGVINHGLTSSINVDPTYSIQRNESLIRSNTFNDIEGGIRTKLHVNPNGSKIFTQPAFNLNYIAAFYGTDNGTPYFDVTTRTFSLDGNLEMGRFVAQKTNLITSLTNQLNNESSDTKKLWAAAVSHKVTDRNHGYSFSDFVSYMQNIEANFGKNGSDNIWMASSEEVLQYLILKDLISIQSSQNENKYIITFDGNLPTDFRFYALSLNIASDQKITNIKINGGIDCTYKINNNEALINLNWKGRTIETAEDLAENYVEKAEQSKKLEDALIAMDYVNMIADGDNIKTLYANRLCNIPGISLPEEFCNCGTQEKFETTICPNTTIELAAPEGGDAYVWNTGSTESKIEVSPADTSIYFVTVFKDDVCFGSKTFTINTYPLGFADAGVDQSICIPNCTELQASGGESYLWNTDQTSSAIEVCPTTTTDYIVEVTNSEGCVDKDTVKVIANTRLPLNLPEKKSIFYGDQVTLKAENTNDCLWSNGETDNEITVAPIRNTTYTITDTDPNGCKIKDSTLIVLSYPISEETDYNTAINSTKTNAINSIIINFESDPTFANITKTPLRYNKDIALSLHIENGDKDVYSHALPFLKGGIIDGTNYPGLTFTDGCDNEVNFKLGTSIFSFSSDSIDVHDPSNNQTTDFISWSEIIELYEEGWGIYSQGFVQDSTKSPHYSIGRNHSYVKYKTYNSIPGGIPMTVLINPKQSQSFNTPASAQNYRMAIKPDASSIHYQDVGSWPAAEFYELTRNALDDGSSLSAIADELNNNKQSWASATISSITDRSSEGYTFDVFRFHMNYLEDEYGSKGSDIIWVAPEEEVWDYRIVYDKTTVSKELRGSQLLITFSGDIPTNLNHYALSLLVESDANISSIEINGGGSHTHQIKQDTSALINLSWNGKTLVADTVTAKYFVGIAEANKTTYDALIAMDYVNMLDSELELKKDLKDRLCAITGIELPEGYCSCEFSLGNDTTICFDDCVTLTAPEGTSYLWNTGATTQEIEACPADTNKYYVTVTNQYDCSATDTIQINVEPELDIKTSNDTTICPGHEIKLWASRGTSYEWSTGATTDTIIVSPSVAVKYFVTVFNARDCRKTDSIQVSMHSLPNANAGADKTICPGECIDLTATGGHSYKWSTGEETNIINVCPDTDSSLYIVTVYDQNQCEAKDTVMITLDAPPVITVSNDTAKCYSDCIDLTANGAITYEWSTGETGQTIEVCPTIPTTYYVEGIDQNGCRAKDSVKVDIKGIDNISIAGLLPVYCTNDDLVILDGNPSGGVFGGPGMTDNIFSPSNAGVGEHKIHYTVTDNDGCKSADTVNVTIYDIPQISLGKDTTLCTDESLEIFNPSTYDSYYWSNGNTGHYINVNIDNMGYGTNTLTLTVTHNGCVNKDEVNITFETCNVGIEDLEEIGINVYPNPSQGIFNITYDGTEDNLHFRIFNLQGQEVYSEHLNDKSDKNAIKEINVSFLKKGLYIIRFYSKKGIRSGKLSIQ